MQANNEIYFEITDLWKLLCEEHNLLFNLVSDEYLLLLESKIEEIEKIVPEKKVVINRISKLDFIRQNLIKKINSSLKGQEQIKSSNDLIRFLGTNPIEREQKHFLRFNTLLNRTIEKLKQQNRRNQLFLNKAMISLNDWKRAALGNKSFSTYNSSGETISKGA
jgi:flagellar biosynthesis/type III secretory pathway chaperone